MKNFLTIAILLQSILISIQAQDLIERAQLGEAAVTAEKKADKLNRLAELITQNRKHAKTNSVVDVFTFNKNTNAKTRENVDKSVELILDETVTNLLLNEKRDWLTLKVPVNENNYFELELVRHNIQKPGYKVTLSNPVTQPYQPADMVFYKGIIKNDNQSLAAVTISDNQIRILASDRDGNYIVGKLPNSDSKYVLYNDVNLKQDPPLSCGTPYEPQTGSVDANTAGTTTVNGQCVPVYIEADFTFYQDNGNSINNVEVYLNGLFNEVETIYFNESIGVGISEIYVHTVPGPYYNMTNTNDALRAFNQLRQNNFNGRLAHLVSGRPLGGGRAWVDMLCSINYNHAVSQLYGYYYAFPTYSWDVYVFAHEMGHNFGSWHTHDCVWNGNNTAIDGCGTPDVCSRPGIPPSGGTIMSYCHLISDINFSLGFGSQPGDLLRNRFNNSSCILECEESCNYVGNPCNFIPNPNFDNDITSWGWWNCDISTSLGICKIENIVGGADPWSAIVNSDYLCLVQGVTYNVSFDAFSETQREFYVKVGLGEPPWTSYLWEPLTATTNFQNYTYQFTHTLPSTSIGVLEFHVGGSNNLSNVYLDNIVLQPAECSGNEVCEKVENGDFENGFTNWDYWGMDQPEIIGGECFLSNFYTVDGYVVSWNSALNYADITLEQNQIYTIQFSARSVNAPRTFIIKSGLGEAPWTSYIWETVYLTTQMQTFSYTFTMPEATISNGTLEFQVGDNTIPLYIDDVTFIDNNCQSAGLSNLCVENMSLDGVPNTHIYQAGAKITSKAEIGNNANVTYFAGDNISLESGFKVANGAVFKGAIEGCD